ncbi:MAG: HIRAN domain-containing protein [Janthinobacterium lividum]
MAATPPLILLECLIAGTSHRPELPKQEKLLQVGQTLHLRREADSKYDDWAVQVHSGPASDKASVWLGYLPETRNETIARLLDAGFPLSARLAHKAWEEEWLHLEIEVLLPR